MTRTAKQRLDLLLVQQHLAESREQAPVSYTHLTLPTSDLV